MIINTPNIIPVELFCFLDIFCRNIHLVTTCRVVWFRHFQQSRFNHRGDIDIHHVLPGFQPQMLHDVKQRLGFCTESQDFRFFLLLPAGRSCTFFLGCFLGLFSWVVFLGCFLGMFSWDVFLGCFGESCFPSRKVSTT